MNTSLKVPIWTPEMLKKAEQWWNSNGGHFNVELYQKIKQIRLPKKVKLA